MSKMQQFYERLTSFTPACDPHFVALAQITNLEPHAVATVPEGRTWHEWAQTENAQAAA